MPRSWRFLSQTQHWVIKTQWLEGSRPPRHSLDNSWRIQTVVESVCKRASTKTEKKSLQKISSGFCKSRLFSIHSIRFFSRVDVCDSSLIMRSDKLWSFAPGYGKYKLMLTSAEQTTMSLSWTPRRTVSSGDGRWCSSSKTLRISAAVDCNNELKGTGVQWAERNWAFWTL